MATAWPTLARADLDEDKPGRTGCIAALIARDACMLRRPFQLYFAEATTNSLTYASIASPSIWVPEVWLGLTMTIKIEARRNNTSNATSWQVRDFNGSVVLGSPQAVTTTTYAVTAAYSFTIPTTWTPNAERDLEIQAISGGALTSFYARSITTLECWVTD